MLLKVFNLDIDSLTSLFLRVRACPDMLATVVIPYKFPLNLAVKPYNHD
jgi:hypothetical protein